MTELDKLEQYLKDNNIEYERIDENEGLGFHQIVVPSRKNREWDAICHYGSYGYEKGLLEIMGTIVDYDKVGDSVEGWLTADDVVERMKRYDEQKS